MPRGKTEQEYGVFRYTVPANDCPPDTAYVTVIPPTPFRHLLPLADASVLLCRNKSLIWDVGIPKVGSVVWDDGTTDLTRVISQAGFYTGIVTDPGGCLSEEIFLKVSDAPAPQPSNELARYCIGDTVLLASGYPLTTDSIVDITFDRGLRCDSIHRIFYRFRPPVEALSSSTICLGDTLIIGNQAFTTAGNYDILLPGGTCDTLLRLELTTSPPDTVYLDTVLASGQTLEIAGVRYDTAGNYRQYFPDEGDCGRVLVIDLDFTTSTRYNDPSDRFWYPTLLRAGTDALSFHPRSTGKVLVVERLEVFDLNGRKVSVENQTWLPGSSLAAGVYIFRVRLRIDGVIIERTGRVVVSK